MGEAMTTNQTIDGVPRELLEQSEAAFKTLLSRIQDNAEDCDYWRARFEGQRVQLRALLDSPAKPENDTVAVSAHWTDWSMVTLEIDGRHRTYVECGKPSAQSQGEPVAWRTYRGGAYELFGSLQEAEDDIAQWASIAAPHDDYDRAPTPLYAEQPAPVASICCGSCPGGCVIGAKP